MPKRKCDDLDSLNYIKKKIKKLERKLLKSQRCRSSSPPDSVHKSTETQDDVINESENVEMLTADLDELEPTTGTSQWNSLLALNAPEVTFEPPQPATEQPSPTEKEDQESQELDETVLEILGTDPLTTVTFRKDIQKDLAIRLEFIATSGLTKELRKELLESHLPPANCKMIDAPSLNPEIKAAITEVIVKRDKAIQAKQKQICSAIACLSEAITLLLSKDTKDPTILKLLMDTARILCDSQHKDSVTRRSFILATLKRELKDQMQLTKIDNLLFGQELSDTLRTAKAINKSGAELKAVTTQRVFANKPKNLSSNKNLNWKAPAPSRRLTGPQRAKEPAPSTRQQQLPSSRASRPGNSRGRR
ncbi:unnamed protein product [Parnassius mnemosyne]|uniref:Uncharacterized protein n=1 Tax=Parnassius mnemosyne TaxID=213953 RepID=A0AAV1LKP1_9NEOP